MQSKVTPKEFFEGEWYKDGIKQLCADGWPTFVVPVNIQVRNLLEENQKLQRRIDVFERAKRIWDRRSSGEYSDLNDASQEAAHYCWLDEQNEKLSEALKISSEALKEIARHTSAYSGASSPEANLAKKTLRELGVE